MKKQFLASLATVLFFLVSTCVASATVLNFDDLTTSYYDSLPADYGGLTWDSSWVYVNGTEASLVGSGYDYGATSGTNTAVNLNAADVSIEGSMYFNGAYFTAAWTDNLTLTVEGYNGTNLLYSETLTLSNTTPQWFDAGWSGITSLTFDVNSDWFAMDDFTFNEAAPVPEPTTMFLFGIGIASLAGTRIRRKKK